jgi:hypothetical protein
MVQRKGLFTGLVTAVCALLLVSSAQADPTLDFAVAAPTAGSITYAGGANPLIGTNIEVDNVIGIMTALNPPPQPRLCFSCVLNFTTGNIQSATSTVWTFGANGTPGSITLVGEVDLNGNGLADDGGAVTLFTGFFSDVTTVTAAGSTFKVAISSFSDIKDTALLNLYGLPTGVPYSGNFNISFNATGLPPGALTSTTLLSGDITNVPTPEPGTLLLLGSGLAGFGYLARRRRRA